MTKTLPNFSGKIYPDRSFSAGYIPFHKKRKAERDYDRDYRNQSHNLSKKGFASKAESDAKASENQELYRNFSSFNNSSESSQTLEKILEADVEQQVQAKKKYGTNGITRLGRKIAKNGAILLQQKYGKKRLGLVTMTCPNYRPHQLKIISQNWSEIQRQFFQQLKRRLIKIGQPVEIVSCTEIQPKRYSNRGEVAPHLHFVYVCKERAHIKKFNILANSFRRWWKAAIENVLSKYGEKTPPETTFAICCDCQPIRKCVGRYLGKYISKGGEVVEKIVDEGRSDELPSQWWTASKEMKLMFKLSLIQLSENECSFLIYNLELLISDGYLIDGKLIEVDIGGQMLVVGASGIFSDAFYQTFIDN